MSILKYIDRLKRMDDLIRRKATGTAQEFAEKLGISPSQLFQDLKEMRTLGAPIDYCPKRKSYFYEKEGKLVLDFATEGQALKGGQNIFENFTHSSMAGEIHFILAAQGC
jgi:Mn-dependent DtxR family transcriptional regulator